MTQPDRETPHPLGDLAEMIASALTGHYQGRWPDHATLESFVRRLLLRSPVLAEMARLPAILAAGRPGVPDGFLPPALPPAEREADRVREVLRHEGTVEAAATRLGWSRWAVRFAMGRRHEGACQDPDPAEAELLADDFARRLVLGGVLIEARLQIPEAAGREAVDCVVAACEVAGPGDPPVTRWVAGPVSGATADDLYHAGERTLVHDASGRAIHVLAVGASRSEAIHRACQRLSVEGPAAPAVRWDGDEQRVAALVRLKAIRAEMEALRPGSTRDRPGPRPIRGVEQPPPGPGFEYDADGGRVGYLALAGDGRGAVELVEGSWLPAAGPMSDSAGALPEGEAPRATAARLLNASMIELVASRSPSALAPQGEGSIWDMPDEPPDPAQVAAAMAAELRPDPEDDEVALTYDDPPGVEFWADEGDAVVRYALRWSPDDPVWGWTLESRGEDCDEFRTIVDVSERFSQVWLTLEDFKVDEEPYHVDRLIEAVARAAGVDLTAATAAQERDRHEGAQLGAQAMDYGEIDQEQDFAVTARDEDFEPLSVETDGDDEEGEGHG